MNAEKIETDKKLLLIAGILFFGAVAIAIPIALVEGRAARESVQWASVEAKIEQATVRRRSSKSGRWFENELAYVYRVGGIEYHGGPSAMSTFVPVPRWDNEELAIRSLPKVGSTITVRFDPKNPTQSVRYVSHPMGADYLAASFAGVVACLAGYFSIAPARRLLRHARAQNI